MTSPRTAHMQPPAVSMRRPGLVWPVRRDPRGVDGPTPAQARGPLWWSPTRGLLLPAGLDPALATDQRIVTAAALLPTGGAITGWAALRWQGVRYLDGQRGARPLPVDVAVPDWSIRNRAGLRVVTERLLLREAQEVDGLTVSAAGPATAFAARRAPTLTDAVTIIDLAAAGDLVSIEEVRQVRGSLVGARDVARLDRALDLSVENCWSPMETVMRLSWHALGITDVVCNRPVFDLGGNFLGTPDLLDLRHGVVGEYDGALHLAGERRGSDIRREGVLRRAGLEYVEMVAADLRDPSDFHRRTRDAQARASRLARHWTIEPPPGWVETHTVEMRRALSEWERARYLRWQRR